MTATVSLAVHLHFRVLKQVAIPNPPKIFPSNLNIRGFGRMKKNFSTSIKYRKRRDELQHNVFLMLQETNKFREHQARELLIEILEKQNEEREKLINELEDKIQQTDALLLNENPSNATSMDESS